MCVSRSERIATRSLVPCGARLRRRISSCRRGSDAKCNRLPLPSPGCACQASIALSELGPVRAEIARQRLEEGNPARSVKLVVAVEHLARHRRAGSLAGARQQRFAQFDQVGGVFLAVGGVSPSQQAAAALGNGRQQVGEEGVGHDFNLVREAPNPPLDLGRTLSQSSGGPGFHKFRRRLARHLPERVGKRGDTGITEIGGDLFHRGIGLGRQPLDGGGDSRPLAPALEAKVGSRPKTAATRSAPRCRLFGRGPRFHARRQVRAARCRRRGGSAPPAAAG